MVSWQLEVFKMGCYVLFPMAMTFIVNTDIMHKPMIESIERHRDRDGEKESYYLYQETEKLQRERQKYWESLIKEEEKKHRK